MSVNHHIASEILVQGELLVSVAEVKFREILSPAKSGKEVLNPGNRIAVKLGYWIDCHAKITANPDTLFILLQDNNYRCCPLSYVYSIVPSFCRR